MQTRQKKPPEWILGLVGILGLSWAFLCVALINAGFDRTSQYVSTKLPELMLPLYISKH